MTYKIVTTFICCVTIAVCIFLVVVMNDPYYEGLFTAVASFTAYMMAQP